MMTYSENLVSSIKLEEGFTPIAHHLEGDRPGVITGGYGSTDVELGETFTEARACCELHHRLDQCALTVRRLVHVPLTQGQFDALCDFCYNLGAVALQQSTLLKLLNSGDYAGADQEFLRWNHADGKILAGLTHRRMLEAGWFDTPAVAA